MHRNRVLMLTLRAEWKREGICTRCGKEPALPTRTRGALCVFADWMRRKNILVVQVDSAHPVPASS